MSELNTKVITGKVRFSYANVWEPKSINESKPKYSISLLIPKSDEKTLKDIRQAIENAKKIGDHDTDIVEIVSDINFREKYNLKDNDFISIEIF